MVIAPVQGFTANNLFDGARILGLGTLAAPALTFDSDTDTGIYSPSADILGIVAGTVEAARFTTTGVTLAGITTLNGVAYTWPGADGSLGDQLTTNGGGTLSWAPSGAATSGWIDDGVVVRLITSTDDVGIGTAAPGAKLHVLGDTVGDITSIIQAVAAQTADLLQLQDSASSVVFGVDIAGNADIRGVPYTWPAANAAGFLENDGAGVLAWNPVTDPGWTDDGTVVRLTTITDNVGIGTVGPGAKIHVVGDTVGEITSIIQAVAAQTADLGQWQDSASTVVAAFDIAGNATIRGVSYTWPAANAAGFLENDGAGILGWNAVPDPGWTDDGTVVRLTTITDTVGVGTVSPGGKFHVLGTADVVTGIIQGAPAQTANLFQIQNNAGSILNRVTIDGDLGINTASVFGQIHITQRLASVKGIRITGSGSGFNQLYIESAVGAAARMLTKLISNSGTILIRLGVGHLPFSFNAGITGASDVIMAVVPVNTATTIGCFNPSAGVNAIAGFRCGEVVDGGNEIRIDCFSSGFTTNQLNVANRSRIFVRADFGLTVLLNSSATTANYQIAVDGNLTDNVRFIVNNSATVKGVTIGRVVPTGTEALSNIHIFDAAIIGLAIEAESAQTANLTEWRDNTGAILAFVDASGNFDISGKLTVGGVIDPTALLLTGSSKKLGATDAGTIFLAPFSDTTTAIQFRESDDTTVVMNIDTTNGNVGIGTTSPISGIGRTLEISDNSTVQGANLSLERVDASVTAGNPIGSVLFVGGESGTSLAVGSIIVSADLAWTPTSSPTRMIFSTTVSGGTSDTERMRIDSSGVVSITGTLTVGTAPTYTVTNGVIDRTYDANLTSVNELADVIFSVISDLQTVGLFQ